MNTYTYRTLSLVALLFICAVSAKAQQPDHTLLTTDADFARISQNPSYIPDHDRVIVGLPFISQVSLDLRLPVAPSSVLHKDEKGTYLILDRALRSAAGQPFLAMANTDLFTYGEKFGSGFYSIQLGIRADVAMALPTSLADFVANGNAHYMGRDHSLGHIPMAHRRYVQLAIGYANDRILKRRNLRIGGRLKLLTMASGAFSDGGDFVFRTDDRGRTLALSGTQHYVVNSPKKLRVNSEGDVDLGALGRDMLHDKSFSNYGLGMDLGAEYRLDRHWSFGFSITDLGFIRWNGKNLKSVELDLSGDKALEFKGVDFSNALINKNQGKDPSLDALIRQLESAVTARDAERSYFSSLYTRLGATAEYTPTDPVKIKALVGGAWVSGLFHYEAALSSSYRPARFFTMAASVSSMKSTPFSLGGAVILGDGFQTIFAVDNLLVLDYTGVRRAAVRLGISLRF